MKKVFIISLYEKKLNQGHLFHFKGFYLGQKIKQIIVQGGEFEFNSAYVLALEDVSVCDETLFGRCVKSKKVFS